jgi:hypothetical protein
MDPTTPIRHRRGGTGLAVSLLRATLHGVTETAWGYPEEPSERAPCPLRLVAVTSLYSRRTANPHRQTRPAGPGRCSWASDEDWRGLIGWATHQNHTVENRQRMGEHPLITPTSLEVLLAGQVERAARARELERIRGGAHATTARRSARSATSRSTLAGSSRRPRPVRTESSRPSFASWRTRSGVTPSCRATWAVVGQSATDLISCASEQHKGPDRLATVRA